MAQRTAGTGSARTMKTEYQRQQMGDGRWESECRRQKAEGRMQNPTSRTTHHASPITHHVSRFTFHAPRAARAFTLIELLIVISIIALLAALTFPAVRGARISVMRARARSELTQIESAIERYKDKLGYYPPDNPPPSGSWWAMNQLYYELLGTTNIGTGYVTLDGSAQIRASDFGTAFGPGVTGFMNSHATRPWRRSSNRSLLFDRPQAWSGHGAHEHLRPVVHDTCLCSRWAAGSGQRRRGQSQPLALQFLEPVSQSEVLRLVD